MTTSTDSEEGTSNIERITAEVRRAAQELPERFPGYRDSVTDAAIECYVLAAEHDEQRININQKYDELISALARSMRAVDEGNQ